MSTDAELHAAGCELVSEVGRSAGEVRLRVTGASMLPAIWPGDEIGVVRCDFADLLPGHVVLYRREGTLTAHRIVSIFIDHLITRGDSVPTPDPRVQAGEIVGRVASITRGRRTFDPAQTAGQRIASSILRNSDFCLRVTLYLNRRWRRRTPLPK